MQINVNFQNIANLSKFPKKSEPCTTTNMHCTTFYFFQMDPPPPGHTQKSDSFGKTSACTSSLGVEVTDRGKSAQINKAVLPKPAPQFGHFSLALLICIYEQFQFGIGIMGKNRARKQWFAIYICCPRIPRSFFFPDQRDGSQSFEIRHCFQVLGGEGGKYLAREP